MTTRRRFLSSLARTAAGALIAGAGLRCASRRDAAAPSKAGAAPAADAPLFRARGVVLVPDDLSLADWPLRAQRCGLDRIALHHGLSPARVTDFIRSPAGGRFLASCRELGLEVEYELHAMRELLPRELFAKDATLFRMNEKGERVNDVNLCVHSSRALDLVAENALVLTATLKPTTHRHFLWGDDGEPWCRCPQCRDLSESDQALVVENRLVQALRRRDAQAELAHLAYANTLPPPVAIRPEPGVFLEFAPLEMRFKHPLTPLAAAENAQVLARLDANLAVFPRETAQALEYWLDDSMYSGWRKPAQPLRWSDDVFASDLDTYAARGVRRITSFAVYLDADYVARLGFPDAVARYGSMLSARRAAH